MGIGDLFLRSPAKASNTDLWLTPAGPSGAGPPPFVSDSGTVAVLVALTGVESVAEAGTVGAGAAFSDALSLVDAGSVTSTATLSGSEAITDAGTIAAVVAMTLVEAVAEAGGGGATATGSAIEAIADEGQLLSVAQVDGSHVLAGEPELPPPPPPPPAPPPLGGGGVGPWMMPRPARLPSAPLPAIVDSGTVRVVAVLSGTGRVVRDLEQGLADPIPKKVKRIAVVPKIVERVRALIPSRPRAPKRRSEPALAPVLTLAPIHADAVVRGIAWHEGQHVVVDAVHGSPESSVSSTGWVVSHVALQGDAMLVEADWSADDEELLLLVGAAMSLSLSGLD